MQVLKLREVKGEEKENKRCDLTKTFQGSQILLYWKWSSHGIWSKRHRDCGGFNAMKVMLESPKSLHVPCVTYKKWWSIPSQPLYSLHKSDDTIHHNFCGLFSSHKMLMITYI